MLWGTDGGLRPWTNPLRWRSDSSRTAPTCGPWMLGSVSEADDAVQEAWLVAIDLLADPALLGQLDLVLLDD